MIDKQTLLSFCLCFYITDFCFWIFYYDMIITKLLDIILFIMKILTPFLKSGTIYFSQSRWLHKNYTLIIVIVVLF